jgi:hypothetical protein
MHGVLTITLVRGEQRAKRDEGRDETRWDETLTLTRLFTLRLPVRRVPALLYTRMTTQFDRVYRGLSTEHGSALFFR